MASSAKPTARGSAALTALTGAMLLTCAPLPAADAGRGLIRGLIRGRALGLQCFQQEFRGFLPEDWLVPYLRLQGCFGIFIVHDYSFPDEVLPDAAWEGCVCVAADAVDEARIPCARFHEENDLC